MKQSNKSLFRCATISLSFSLSCFFFPFHLRFLLFPFTLKFLSIVQFLFSLCVCTKASHNFKWFEWELHHNRHVTWHKQMPRSSNELATSFNFLQFILTQNTRSRLAHSFLDSFGDSSLNECHLFGVCDVCSVSRGSAQLVLRIAFAFGFIQFNFSCCDNLWHGNSFHSNFNALWSLSLCLCPM